MISSSSKPAAKVAVTGAYGFIGRQVTALLQELACPYSQLEPHEPAGGTAAGHWVCWDLRADVDQTARALQGIDVLIHLAAYIPPDFDDPGELPRCLTLNAIGTANLLRAAEAAGVRQFIHASTAALYDSENEICTPDSPLFPRRSIPYLSSKLAAEVYVQHAARNSSMVCSILRLASVYGPGMNGRGLVPECVRQLMSAGAFRVADGNRYRTDLVYVADVARAFVHAIGRKTSGIYNIACGRLTSPQEVALCVADLLKLSASSISVAPPAGEKPESESLARLDVSGTRSELRFFPLALRNGLERYIESIQ